MRTAWGFTRHARHRIWERMTMRTAEDMNMRVFGVSGLGGSLVSGMLSKGYWMRWIRVAQIYRYAVSIENEFLRIARMLSIFVVFIVNEFSTKIRIALFELWSFSFLWSDWASYSRQSQRWLSICKCTHTKCASNLPSWLMFSVRPVSWLTNSYEMAALEDRGGPKNVANCQSNSFLLLCHI